MIAFAELFSRASSLAALSVARTGVYAAYAGDMSAPRRRTWLDARPLRRARRRLQKGHGIGRRWTRAPVSATAAALTAPARAAELDHVTLFERYYINGVAYGPGVVHVTPDDAATLREATRWRVL